MKINIKNSDETQATINYMRADRFFRAKNINGSNLRKLFTGLAVEISRAEGKIQEIVDQYDIESTTALLDEWESALGIPDDNIKVVENIDDRRNNIIMKLVALGVSTKEGFENLGTILGINITVHAGIEKLVFPYTFPILLLDQNPRWIMFVEGDAADAAYSFPYTFPFLFGENTIESLQNLFQALVPAPVKVVFNFV